MDFLNLKVGGMPFIILNANLERYPDTFLGRFALMSHEERMDECDGYFPSGDFYYFDRPAFLFESICMLYRLDVLRPPVGVCREIFDMELEFWEIDDAFIIPCSCCGPTHSRTLPPSRSNSISKGPMPKATRKSVVSIESPFLCPTECKSADSPVELVVKDETDAPVLRKVPNMTNGKLPSVSDLLDITKETSKTELLKPPKTSHHTTRKLTASGFNGPVSPGRTTSFSRQNQLPQSLQASMMWLNLVRTMEGKATESACARARDVVWMELNYFKCGIGRVFEFLSLAFILLTVACLSAESYPEIRHDMCVKGFQVSRAGNPLHHLNLTRTPETQYNFTFNSTYDDYWCNAHVITYLDLIDMVCVTWFTMEFALYLWAAPSQTTFLLSPLGIIDILSIFPVYVEYLLKFVGTINAEDYGKVSQGLMIFRTLRCLRVVRILKIVRYSRGLKVIGTVFKRSFTELMLVFIYTFILTAFFATLVYYAEFGNEKTPFNNIPTASWWAIVTLTTLGYGDLIPVTAVGKVIAAIATMSGVVLLAFPISIIVERFTMLYAEVVPSRGSGGSREKAEGGAPKKGKAKKIGKHIRIQKTTQYGKGSDGLS